MNQLLFPLLTLLNEWMKPRYNARLRFLECQIQLLRARIDASRIVPTPQERDTLLQLGALCEHDIYDLLHVVVPETYRTWLRKSRRGETYKASGRARVAQSVRELIERIAKENRGWSYRRICGEIKKLGVLVGATTVRRVMMQCGLQPTPPLKQEEPPSAWTTFIKSHMDSLVACDFFSKKIVTLHGVYSAYVLVFIHLGTRKVYHSYPTYNPDGQWVTQQFRNASMWIEDEGLDIRFLIHDRDRKYPDKIKAFWKAEDVTTIPTPYRSPKANAFCEAFVGTIKRECLNKFFCFSLGHLHHINSVWIRYYNSRRPHRGVRRANDVLDVDFKPTSEGRVRCKEELGGVIRSYYREAA